MRKVIAIGLMLMFLTSTVHADWAKYGDQRWRKYVTNVVDLPTFANQVGDVRYVTSVGAVYGWNGATWVVIGSSSDLFVGVTAADTTPSYLDDKLTAGDGLDKTIINPGANEVLDLDVKYDDASIGLDGGGDLYVKDAGIIPGMLNSSLEGDAIDITIPGLIAVKYDNVTLGLDGSFDLSVKDDGVSEPKLAMNNAPTTNYFVRWNGASMEWASVSGTVSMDAITMAVAQALHGFTAGDVLRWDSIASELTEAQADNVANAEVVGIVSYVTDPNNFTILFAGYCDTLSGLVEGDTYFLSPTVAGALTNTAPSSVGQINKPLLITDSTTSGVFVNFRGIEIGDPTAPADATFVTISNTGDLSAERALTAGTAITRTDGGANSTVTLSVTPNAIGDTQLTYNTGQHLTTASAVTFLTVNTGQGANELYDMDQNVMTSSSVEFAALECDDIDPSGDGNGDIGAPGNRFGNIYGVNIEAGDLGFMNKWRITEDWENGGLMLLSPDGKKYKFVLEEIQ